MENLAKVVKSLESMAANKNILAKQLEAAKADNTKHITKIAELVKCLDTAKSEDQTFKELTVTKKELIEAKDEIKELNEEVKFLDETLRKTKDTVAALNKAVAKKNVISNELKSAKVDLINIKKNVNSLSQTVEINNKEIANKNAIIQVLSADGTATSSDAVKLICSICTSALIQNDSTVATRCGHIYHNDCLQPWLNTYVNHFTSLILINLQIILRQVQKICFYISVRSRTCPECRKPSRKEELLRLYLGI